MTYDWNPCYVSSGSHSSLFFALHCAELPLRAKDIRVPLGAPEVRNFQGAMVGRADKGLFITAERFTKEAQREAVRNGAPAIDLIDGNDFCHLLKEFGRGVRTETQEAVVPQREFFEGFEKEN